MDMQSAIKSVTQKQNLSADDMDAVMGQIMTGQATDAQIGGFLIGLQMKGETINEITAAAKVMRDLATPLNIEGSYIVDTCGTGGDGSSTFNVSTASAFVAAAAGAKVAKHGNRSISSSSGSADVLEAAGVNLDIDVVKVKNCIDNIGVGFMFAQKHHSAMKHAIGPRRQIAVRTIFNLLGPLTNPARVKHQVLGVFHKKWVEPMAKVLHELGSKHVLVVHAEDGLDEISIGSNTFIAELNKDEISTYTISPEEFGLHRADIKKLAVTDAQHSLQIIKAVFAGKEGPARDIVILNAGAAIYAADLSPSLVDGISVAKTMIDSGHAQKKLDEFVIGTNS